MAAQRPIILGLVGDSASGKTTLTNGLADILGLDRVTSICTDDYHRYDRKERAKIGITALHPDCNYLDILEQHLRLLRDGEPILKPVYDHSNGTLTRPEYIVPREFVIAEGLLGFTTARMRECFDVKVYLDPPEDLRRVWKVRRDTTKRGYTPEQVLAELEKRETDSRDFIRPQRVHADMVVRFSPPKGVSAEEANGHLDAELVLRPTIPHPNFSEVLENGNRVTRRPIPAVRVELGRDSGLPVDFLKIDGDVKPDEAAELETVIWNHLPEAKRLRPEMIGTYQDGVESKHSDPLGLTQLLIAYHLIRASHANE
jgi:phosphoribulokinase